MLRKLFFSLLLLVCVMGLPAETYVITGEGFHFVCKEAESIEHFLLALAEMTDGAMSGLESLATFVDLSIEYACLFILPGSQLHISDDAEEMALSIVGEHFTISSAEIIGEDRRMCIVNDDDECSIVDFSGEVWYVLDLLDEGGAVMLR